MIGKGLLRTVMSLALVGLCLSYASAQDRTVSGKVTDETGEGLPGVNVVIKGTSDGTVTDFDGNYRLSVPEGGTIVFSAVGFANQEIQPGSRSVLDVGLEIDVAELAEVIVTGYATQDKKDITGSVAVVEPKELTQVPSANIVNQLQGRAAGVTVVGNGQPGTVAKIRIRGIGSLSGQNDPLYIVDGIPTFDIATINPEDVESISVLKDAGAAAIYGSRGSNGVVIITTKKGLDGIRINGGFFHGTQYPGSGPDNMLNTQGYADLQWLVYDNDGTVETHPIYGESTNASPTLPPWAADTDWYDEITNPASIMNYDLSMAAGRDDARFFASLNYFEQDGIIRTTNFRRVSGRINTDFTIGNRVTIGQNLNVTYNDGNDVPNLQEAAPINGVYRNQPIIPVFMNQTVDGISRTFVPGEYGGTGLSPRLGNGSNTVAVLQRDKDDVFQNIRLLGNFFIDVKIIEGLNFRSSLGGTRGSAYFTNYTFATYEDSENVATPNFVEGANYGGEWVFTNTLSYDKVFGAHALKVVAGYEALEYGIGRGVSGQRGGYFSDEVSFRTLNNGATILNASSGVATPITIASQFMRVDYAFQDKYLLAGTIRRDGSSVFGEDTRYGVFPSVSAGWRISEENFLAGNAIFTDVKIRGGWGQLGNQLPVNPLNQFSLFGGSPNTSNYDLTGTGTSSLQGFRPTTIANPDAKWETNTTANIGFDAGLFDNQLEVIFDAYSKVTSDLLFSPELPGVAGAASAPAQNVGEVENRGIDLQVIYRTEITSDLKIEANATFTRYATEIVSIAGNQSEFPFGGSRIGTFALNREGREFSEFFGYEVEGLFQSQAEVDAAPTQDGAEAGFFRYKDIDGNGEINDLDRTFIGNPNPDFVYGLNLTVNYKQFELVAYVLGYQGGDLFNYTKWWTDFWPSFQGQKSKDLLNNSWTESRTNAKTPKASNVSNLSTNGTSNSYYVEDGTFTRLKNLQLTWNVPASILDRIGFSSASVYVQGLNLFTITDYSGVDPEIGGDDRAFGIDYGNFPTARQFVFGARFGLNNDKYNN